MFRLMRFLLLRRLHSPLVPAAATAVFHLDRLRLVLLHWDRLPAAERVIPAPALRAGPRRLLLHQWPLLPSRGSRGILAAGAKKRRPATGGVAGPREWVRGRGSGVCGAGSGEQARCLMRRRECTRRA